MSGNAPTDGDWVLSKSLRVGDLLKDRTGAWQPILSIEKVDETKATYNFEVAKNHDYFVGQKGWLVHNQSGVLPYEVGQFNVLKGKELVGDGLEIHHAVQKHPAGQIIPGYTADTGASIALPFAEHRAIPNIRGIYNGSARQLLARDIRNLRNFTNTPRSAIRQLIDLNKQQQPNLFRYRTY